jgi:hypothetical protein
MSKSLFIITETEPTTILKDFSTFTGYLTTHSIELSRVNEFISRKALYELNQEMTHPLPDMTQGYEQTKYPLLHLFYHIVIEGKLFQKVPGKGGKFILKSTDRLQRYEELTLTEKYFFLLETFWVDADWEKLQGGHFRSSPLFIVPEFLKYLSEQQPGEKINLKGKVKKPFPLPMLYLWEYFLLYFSYFGFWEVIKDLEDQYSKHYFQAESITPTSFGVVMAQILKETRNIFSWNLPYRRYESGEWKAIPGSICAEEELISIVEKKTKKKKSKSDIKPDKGKPGDPFFLPFVTFFPEGELTKTLPRKGVQFIDGTYVFKISLARDLWRRIRVSADHTLLDLHNSIQEAYDFDNDHLYSFFMDGKTRSRQKFTSSYENDGVCVDEALIGELGLIKGQKILYLFDYGDEWRFQVQLEEIIPDKTEAGLPVIIEKKGGNPVQYKFFGSEYTD